MLAMTNYLIYYFLMVKVGIKWMLQVMEPYGMIIYMKLQYLYQLFLRTLEILLFLAVNLIKRILSR
jgi:hypothetical protein|nr:MAG TPA: hypothetical protein [Crassvirales sp.]